MFSMEQITQAHSKVKSGAGFPAYIAEIKQLGVTSYETHVSDGIPTIMATMSIKQHHKQNTRC